MLLDQIVNPAAITTQIPITIQPLRAQTFPSE
jgi:hypothetical protein